MLLHEKVIIVTGAGGGLGEGISRVCHREGARVVVSDIDGPRALAVAASLERSAVSMQCDVRQDGQLQKLVDLAVERFGRVDGLVNNAGVNCVKPLLETTPDDWQNVLGINLRAPFLLSQMVCRQMLLQQPPGGSIVNIASVHTHGALAGSVTYDAAKWGMVGMTKSMAIDMALARHPHQCRLTRTGGHPDLGRREVGRSGHPAVRRLAVFEHPHQPADRAGRSRRAGRIHAQRSKRMHCRLEHFCRRRHVEPIVEPAFVRIQVGRRRLNASDFAATDNQRSILTPSPPG